MKNRVKAYAINDYLIISIPLSTLRRILKPRIAFTGIELTWREKEILSKVDKGMYNKEIASEMNLGLATIKFHIRRMMKKTGIHNRHELCKALVKHL